MDTLLSKFNKPKWQHRDAEVRRLAIDDLDDANILGELAENDEDPNVRRTAVRKLTDLTRLQRIAQSDSDSEVKDHAQQRFRQLLAGQKEGCPALVQRVEWVNQTADADLLEFIAENGQECELRQAAIPKVKRESVLGNVAIDDSDAELRVLAVNQLTQKSTLDRVFKQTRSRDKQVSRIAKEKSDAILEEIERPERVKTECEAICSRLAILGRTQNWAQDKTDLGRLENRWSAISDDATEECRNRYNELRDTFVSALTAYETREAEKRALEEQYAPIRTVKQDLITIVEGLKVELDELKAIGGEQDADFSQRFESVQVNWDKTEQFGDAQLEKEWQQRFEHLVKQVRKQHETCRQHFHAWKAMTDVCEQAEAWLAEGKFVKAGQLKDLQQRWEAIEQPTEATNALQEAQKRYQALSDKLQAQQTVQNSQRDELLTKLNEKLDQLETALTEGSLHDAIPVEKDARELFDRINEGLTANKRKTLDTRMQKAAAKIRELRSWERWGDNQERERLCEEMEALATNQQGKDAPEETAKQIRDAQEEWKKLNKSGSYSKALWNRFNKACNEAYKPCQAYFAEQAELRKTNMTQKEQVCAELEAFAASLDWSDPDWKGIYNQLREIERRWHNIGPTDRKSRNQLRKRFDDTVQDVEKHLQEEINRNIKFRERLTEKVIAAQNLDNLNEAIETVKKLQGQWHVTVPGNRRQERQLWKTFREACDVVFNRRRQQQDERKKERDDNLAAKSAVCDKIEALTQLSGAEAANLMGQLRKLQSEWQDIGEIPKKSLESAEKRYYRICKAAEKHYQAYLAGQQRLQLTQLRDKAALCEQLERVSAEEMEATLATVQAEWEALPALQEKKWQKKIQKRFEKAVKNAGKQKLPDDALSIRDTLCIRMEILASVESPPEAQKARMAYQVQRLSNAMQGGLEPKSKTDEVAEIERDWYFSHALPEDVGAGLKARFEKALRVFHGEPEVVAVEKSTEATVTEIPVAGEEVTAKVEEETQKQATEVVNEDMPATNEEKIQTAVTETPVANAEATTKVEEETQEQATEVVNEDVPATNEEETQTAVTTTETPVANAEATTKVEEETQEQATEVVNEAAPVVSEEVVVETEGETQIAATVSEIPTVEVTAKAEDAMQEQIMDAVNEAVLAASEEVVVEMEGETQTETTATINEMPATDAAAATKVEKEA